MKNLKEFKGNGFELIEELQKKSQNIYFEINDISMPGISIENNQESKFYYLIEFIKMIEEEDFDLLSLLHK